MRKIRFKRYEIQLEKKKYIVMVPIICKDIHIVDWADWWYGGCFITGTLSGLFTVISSFALLGFNPHVIVYLPVNNILMPYSMATRPENGTFDIVFMTDQSRIRSSTWKKIRTKLRKSNYTIYNFRFDFERIKSYFGNNLKKSGYEDIPKRYFFNKYSADNWLDCDTAFFNFPKLFYQYSTIENYEIFFQDVTQEDIIDCYDEEYDSWTCRMFNYISYYAREKQVNTYQNPPLTVILEHYDLEIANQFVKKSQDYYVRPKDVDHSEDFTNHSYLKITM